MQCTPFLEEAFFMKSRNSAVPSDSRGLGYFTFLGRIDLRNHQLLEESVPESIIEFSKELSLGKKGADCWDLRYSLKDVGG